MFFNYFMLERRYQHCVEFHQTTSSDVVKPYEVVLHECINEVIEIAIS